MPKKIDEITSKIDNLPKQYRTIKDINKADDLYYNLYKEQYKERRGLKRARGYLQSDEYKEGFRKNMNQRRRRFKKRVLEDIKNDDIQLEATDFTEPTPFWQDLWFKQGGGANTLLTENMGKGGDFAAVIKIKDLDANGNEYIKEVREYKNKYLYDQGLAMLYRDLDKQKKAASKAGGSKYFMTKSTIYDVGDLSILDIEVELYS